MKQIEYKSAEYYKELARVDVHEYCDSCGRIWLVADDFSFRVWLPA